MEKKKQLQKVVLAYSGGLDTSIIVPWLQPEEEMYALTTSPQAA